MTNREWLLNKMQNMSDEELAEAIKVPDEMDRVTNCSLQECEQFEDCNVCVAKWLKEEHKEPTKLSDAERVILENVDEKFNYICRDRDGDLYIYVEKPIRRTSNWDDGIVANEFCCYGHLFQFIKWENEQPYSIEELLKGE